MGLIRRLREWREKVDGTLTGPALETDSATVNGTTTTDALEAGGVKKPATGVNCYLSGDQSVQVDTITEINLGESDHFGDVSGTLDPTNNAIDVPSGYNNAEITVGFLWSSANNVDVIRPTKNGNLVNLDGSEGGLGGAYGASIGNNRAVIASFTPLSVTGGDKLRFETRQTTSDPGTLTDLNRNTFINVRFS